MSSADMVGRNTQFRVKAGSRATLQLTVADSSGSGKDLSNTTTYATGKWKVWKPDGTLLIDGVLSFTTRASGIVQYTLSATDTVIANAGIWAGEVELKDNSGNISEQTQTFQFIMEESY
tara:strand:- start:192 stop:548 length:357 start_codon:yes stop_codon:yes gene_type:complete